MTTSHPRLPLSAFIICKDEADYLENCVRSLDVCAEIVVVDSGSTDGTLELLARLTNEGFPIRVLHRDWPGYAAQKQFALDQCTEDWCLNIDADERLDADLRRAVHRLVTAPDGVSGWSIRRRNYLIGFGYTPKIAPEHHLTRLVRRGCGRYDLSNLVHETLIVDGVTQKAPEGTLLHYRPLLLADQIVKENRYSSLKAQQLARDAVRPRPVRAVLGPLWYFLRLFFMRRLYLAGWAGFIEAGTGAMYAFMTEAKLVQAHLATRKPPAEPTDD